MELYTVQMARGRGDPDLLDITIRGQHPVGKHFAPTWKMVMDHKKKTFGHMADTMYTVDYHTMMLASYYANYHVWQMILHKPRVVLMCFCPTGAFCHRHLLVEYLVKLGATYKGEL